MSRPKKGGQGVRRLVTISQKNAAFLQWWEEQESPSTSLALVLADWIERYGFVDVVNRPVRQLPRRDRSRVGALGPSGTTNVRDLFDEAETRGEQSEPHDDARAPEPEHVSSDRADGDRADEVLAHTPAARPAEALAVAAAHSVHTSQRTMSATQDSGDRTAVTEKTPVRVLSDSAPEQLDMNSIFGH